jgi:hypothetical protein
MQTKEKTIDFLDDIETYNLKNQYNIELNDNFKNNQNYINSELIKYKYWYDNIYT